MIKFKNGWPTFFLSDLKKNNCLETNPIKGPKLYMSPELRRAITLDEKNQEDAYKSDVFSLGWLLLEALSLQNLDDLNSSEPKFKTKKSEVLNYIKTKCLLM